MCKTRRVALTRREPAEEAQVSSEGGEGVLRRTRPGRKGKEKGTEEKDNMEAREVLVAKEQTKLNRARGRSRERMKTSWRRKNMRRTSGSKWRLTWRLVARTLRP